MSGENIYLITSLPSLGALGSAAPIAPSDMLAAARPQPDALAIAEAIFVGDDLLQREAVLAGELDQAHPAVLSEAQVRDEEPLPGQLAEDDAHEVGGEADPAASADRLWDRYFRHAAETGRRSQCPFLTEWVAFEVGLRNALVEQRAKMLELDARDFLVAEELGRPAEDYADVIRAWAEAADPLAGLRVLDERRWAWIGEHDAYFTFRNDELGAYAARLMLLTRWKRLEDAAGGEESNRDR